MAKKVKMWNRDELGRFSSAKAVKSVKNTKKVGPKSKVTKDVQRDYILLDGSGSMGSLWAEALGSVNQYANTLAEQKVDTKITLVVFDSSKFLTLRNEVSPSSWRNVDRTEVNPGAMTPLNDSVGRIVDMANAVEPDKAAIIIMTDGLENASRKLNQDQAKAMLDACRAKDWQVVFLGADFDNAAQAASYGNKSSTTVKVSKDNLSMGMSIAARSRGVYSATGANMSFTAEQKRRLA